MREKLKEPKLVERLKLLYILCLFTFVQLSDGAEGEVRMGIDIRYNVQQSDI